MKNLHLFTLALLSLAVSCGTSRTAKNSQQKSVNLESTQWQFYELNGRSLEAIGDSYTLLFKAENALNGKGSCNILFGNYTQNGDGTIAINPLGLTRTACPDMNTESEYIKMLESVTSYMVVGQTTLLLISDMQIVAKLEKSVAE